MKRNPVPTRPNAGKQTGERPHPSKEAVTAEPGPLKLPHDRDEAPEPRGTAASKTVEQAYRDVKRGLVDTDKAPEMDRVYRRIKN